MNRFEDDNVTSILRDSKMRAGKSRERQSGLSSSSGDTSVPASLAVWRQVYEKLSSDFNHGHFQVFCYLQSCCFTRRPSPSVFRQKSFIFQEIRGKDLDKYSFLVFVFDVGNKTWKFYDWSQITTVVSFGKYDPELMCYAHSHGARVVLKGDAPLRDITDPIFRASWIAQKIKLAKTQYMDGINIDIEQEADCFSPEYYALTTLVKETTDSFHREIKGSQVTFDVTWFPKCKDRCYNYAGIADACDFLFVMSYDEQSQALSECIAAANAPYKETLTGYDDYIKIGINPKKLVMGVLWYGYDYTCLNILEDHVCTISKVPSWRASCGITSGHQVPYKIIMKQVNSSISGSHWDKDQQASYYNYKDSSGHFHQVWYDNPQSISLKAAYIQKHGLRGIGMWHANCLDYSGDAVAKQQTKEMWKVLKPKFLQRNIFCQTIKI